MTKKELQDLFMKTVEDKLKNNWIRIKFGFIKTPPKVDIFLVPPGEPKVNGKYDMKYLYGNRYFYRWVGIAKNGDIVNSYPYSDRWDCYKGAWNFYRHYR